MVNDQSCRGVPLGLWESFLRVSSWKASSLGDLNLEGTVWAWSSMDPAEYQGPTPSPWTRTLLAGDKHTAARAARRGWGCRNSQPLLGTNAFSGPFLPGSEEACLHGSPLRSVLLNMPFENDAQWDVCTFVITKSGLVFHNVPANFSGAGREIAESPK